MRWFKHFTDNHRGKSMQTLFDKMGHTGIASYYILMEMCAEKLEKPHEGMVDETSCQFEFTQRIVRQNLRISLGKVREMLDICQGFDLLSYNIDGESVKIKMPILLDLLDYDSKKSRQRRASVAPEQRLDTYVDTEADTEVCMYNEQTPEKIDKKNNMVSQDVSEKQELLSPSQKQDLQFDPDFVEFKNNLCNIFGNRVKKHAADIYLHWDNLESISQFINSRAMAYQKKDDGYKRTKSEKDYIMGALVKEIKGI